MASWNWDEAADREGWVDQSTANTDHDDATVGKQGYDYAAFSEITPDPIACWPLHEDSGSTAHDVSGNNLDGSNSGATLTAAGVVGGSAYSFDGTDDVVSVGDETQLKGLSAMTLMAWFYPNSNQDAGIGKWDFGGTGVEYLLRTDGGNDAWHADLYDGSSVYSAEGGTVAENTWQHVALRWDGSTLEIDVDAATVDSTSANISLNTTPQPFEIGRFDDDSDPEYYDGRMCDVRVYDTRLTDTELQTHVDVVRSPGDWLGTGKLS